MGDRRTVLHHLRVLVAKAVDSLAPRALRPGDPAANLHNQAEPVELPNVGGREDTGNHGRRLCQYRRLPIGARLVLAILTGAVLAFVLAIALAVALAGCGRDAVTAAPGDSQAAREVETYFANQGARFVPGIVVKDVRVADESRGRTLSVRFVSVDPDQPDSFWPLYWGSISADACWTAELNQAGLNLAWVCMQFVYQDGWSETLEVDIARHDITGSTRLRPGPATTRSTQESAAGPTTTAAFLLDQGLTAQAEATLGAFFNAWGAKDLAAYQALLTERRRQDMNLGDWTFAGYDRVEFGPVTAAPEVIEHRVATYGYAYRSDIAEDDVRCFRASITWYYRPGVIGPTESGEALPWLWWLVRGADGKWGVDDWGA